MAQFKVGDVVILKSGGPMMTVMTVHDDGDVNCQWFVDKEMKMGLFPDASLIEPPKGGGW